MELQNQEPAALHYRTWRFNGLSAFTNEAAMTPQREITFGMLLAVIAGGYALYLTLAVKEDE